MADHTEQRLSRLIQALDSRLLELLTDRLDLPESTFEQVAILETARNAAARLLEAAGGPRRPGEPRTILA